MVSALLGRKFKKQQNNIVWTCDKNEWREIPKEGLEHENIRRTPKQDTEIKMGTTGLVCCHIVGEAWLSGDPHNVHTF